MDNLNKERFELFYIKKLTYFFLYIKYQTCSEGKNLNGSNRIIIYAYKSLIFGITYRFFGQFWDNMKLGAGGNSGRQSLE